LNDKKEARAEGGRQFQMEGPVMKKNLLTWKVLEFVKGKPKGQILLSWVTQ